jgi:hypothetical protein
VYVLCFISLNKKILVYKTQHSSTINILTRPCLLDNLAYTAACYQIYMGGGGIGFRIVRFHRKIVRISDLVNILHGFADLINTADCTFI